MKRYSVILAVDVSAYATLDVEAENNAQAIKLARKQAENVSFHIDWDTSRASDDPADTEEFRVVDVLDETSINQH